MASEARTLLLWGETQVGKTTLLTMALFDDQDPLTSIDLEQSRDVLDFAGGETPAPEGKSADRIHA